MLSAEKEVHRAILLLRQEIREQGYTQLEVQKELNWGRSYISQLFTKQKALRYDQILLILRVIGVDPCEFFTALFPPPLLSPIQHFEAPVVPRDHPDETSVYSLRSLLTGCILTMVDKDLATQEEIMKNAQTWHETNEESPGDREPKPPRPWP